MLVRVVLRLNQNFYILDPFWSQNGLLGAIQAQVTSQESGYEGCIALILVASEPANTILSIDCLILGKNRLTYACKTSSLNNVKLDSTCLIKVAKVSELYIDVTSSAIFYLLPESLIPPPTNW